MEKTSRTIPTGIAANTLTSYLHTATLCTTDLSAYQFFYCDAMKMQMEGPFALNEAEKIAQKKLWQIPDQVDYDLYHLYRASVPSLVQLRILHLKTPTPKIHQSYNAYELGSFSLGFPTTNAKDVHQRMKEYGVKAMAPMQIGDIVRADGVPGQYIETIYQGPDYLHVVSIERVGISPLAPCDPLDGFGGPGYSALVVKDTEAEMAFYTKVLDFYPLLDAVWETAEGSALGTGPGIPYRFTSLWPKNWEQNYVILLEFQDGNAIEIDVPSRLPNQGLGMYTFQTTDILRVEERAKANNTTIISPTRIVIDPILGSGKACVMQTPSGFFIELFQQL